VVWWWDFGEMALCSLSFIGTWRWALQGVALGFGLRVGLGLALRVPLKYNIHLSYYYGLDS
jgi:hypothetical protein